MGRKKKNLDDAFKPAPTAAVVAVQLRVAARTQLDDECPRNPEFRIGVAGLMLTAAKSIDDLESARAHAAMQADNVIERAADDYRELEKAREKIRRLETAAKESPAGKKAAPPAAAKAPAAAGAKTCKEHDWDTTKTPPVCKACGKPKSNRGRKSHSNPAANVVVATVAGVAKLDPPSLPLPMPAPAKRGISVELEDGRKVDLDDGDDFAAGAVGGSGR